MNTIELLMGTMVAMMRDQGSTELERYTSSKRLVIGKKKLYFIAVYTAERWQV
jgi:hypothetical protein